jgi:hypothetical protein
MSSAARLVMKNVFPCPASLENAIIHLRKCPGITDQSILLFFFKI